MSADMLKLAAIATFGTLGALSCDDVGSDPRTLLSPSTTRIVLEVDYQTDAVPLTGPVVDGPLADRGDTWNLVENNLAAVSHHAVKVPHTVAEMEHIGAAAASELDLDALLALSKAHRNASLGDGEASLHVMFVNATYRDSAGAHPEVLAVTLGDSGIVAVFVPPIRGGVSTATGTMRAEVLAKFTEQIVLVHELGHALGLVGRGAPVTSAHHDADHGAHCLNPECVMFYMNEGVTDLMTYVQRVVTTSSQVVFDDACVRDVDALVQTLD